jgi:hypothetical protein
VRVYQFRHLGLEGVFSPQTKFSNRANYLFAFTPSLAALFAGAMVSAAGAAALVFAAAAFELASGAGVGVAVVSVPVDCRIEVFPLSAGIAKSSAQSIKVIAAPMVIRESIEAVPRGPKAVLETLLVKSAPASDLPGCKSTAATKTKHDRKNMKNKSVCIKT